MSGTEEEGASGEQLQEEEEGEEEGMEMPAIDVPEMMSDEVRLFVDHVMILPCASPWPGLAWHQRAPLCVVPPCVVSPLAVCGTLYLCTPCIGSRFARFCCSLSAFHVCSSLCLPFSFSVLHFTTYETLQTAVTADC